MTTSTLSGTLSGLTIGRSQVPRTVFSDTCFTLRLFRRGRRETGANRWTCVIVSAVGLAGCTGRNRQGMNDRKAPVITVAVLALVVSCAATPPIDAGYANRVAEFETVVKLPFVTNRAIEYGRDEQRFYGNELGGLSGGTCAVGVDDDDGEGELVGVEGGTVLSTIASLEPYREQGIVVYFHGYYEDFERSCRRAATFKRRLGLDGGFLLFTWPANSTPLTYGDDVDDLEASVPVFLAFLDELGRRFEPQNVSIIGHSLGSRGLVEALRQWPAHSERFRDLVLIAADMDRDLFIDALPTLRSQIEEITVIASDRDLALKVSETVNWAPRLGQSDGVTIEGVTFFDVTDIADTHFSGHVYHLRNGAVVDIIRRVLADEPEPDMP